VRVLGNALLRRRRQHQDLPSDKIEERVRRNERRVGRVGLCDQPEAQRDDAERRVGVVRDRVAEVVGLHDLPARAVAVVEAHAAELDLAAERVSDAVLDAALAAADDDLHARERIAARDLAEVVEQIDRARREHAVAVHDNHRRRLDRVSAFGRGHEFPGDGGRRGETGEGGGCERDGRRGGVDDADGPCADAGAVEGMARLLHDGRRVVDGEADSESVDCRLGELEEVVSVSKKRRIGVR
jgi:hypothetical protein